MLFMNNKYYYYKGIFSILVKFCQYLNFFSINFMILKTLKIIILKIIRLNSTIFKISFQFINFHQQINFFYLK